MGRPTVSARSCRKLFLVLILGAPLIFLASAAEEDNGTEPNIYDMQREIKELREKLNSYVNDTEALKRNRLSRGLGDKADFQYEVLKSFKNFMAEDNKGAPGPQGPVGERGPQGPAGEVVDRMEYLRRQPALRSCGGFITLQGDTKKVIHRLPTGMTPAYNETCAWIIWAANGGPIQVTLKPKSSVAPFQDESKFLVSYNYTKNGIPYNGWFSILTSKKPANSYSSPFVVVFFRASSSDIDHGVEFEVSDTGAKYSAKRPTMVTLDVNSVPSSYQFPPPPQTKYAANERLFLLIKGVTGMRTRVHITDIALPACCDFMRAPSLVITGNDTSSSAWKFSNSNDVKDDSLTMNEPFVLYFESNNSTEGTRFNLNYAYVP